MKGFFRDVCVVARHELTDSVRSRRAIVVLVIYLAGAMLACNGFISALHRLEIQLSEVLQLSAASTPGAVLDGLWRSDRFRQMLTDLIGNREVAGEVLMYHPISLVFGWLVFAFTPVLVMFFVSPRISEELGQGSARYVLVRTPRLAWCFGKYIGQALLLVVVLTVSAIGAWSLARLRLMGMNDLAVARGMVIFAWKAWVYALPFIGLALGISQMTESYIKATGAGFILWGVFGVIGLIADKLSGDGWRQLWCFAGMVVPGGHRLDLWRTGLEHVLGSVVFLVCLGVVYMLIGYVFFSRRDL